MQNKKQKFPQLSTGDIVIIEGHERNRNHWTIGIVESLIVGRDGVTRAAKVRTGNSTLERAIQQLYPLELRCESKSQDKTEVLDDIKKQKKINTKERHCDSTNKNARSGTGRFIRSIVLAYCI